MKIRTCRMGIGIAVAVTMLVTGGANAAFVSTFNTMPIQTNRVSGDLMNTGWYYSGFTNMWVDSSGLGLTVPASSKHDLVQIWSDANYGGKQQEISFTMGKVPVGPFAVMMQVYFWDGASAPGSTDYFHLNTGAGSGNSDWLHWHGHLGYKATGLWSFNPATTASPGTYSANINLPVGKKYFAMVMSINGINAGDISISNMSVPEPATAGLLAVSGLVIALYRRVRKNYGF